MEQRGGKRGQRYSGIISNPIRFEEEAASTSSLERRPRAVLPDELMHMFSRHNGVSSTESGDGSEISTLLMRVYKASDSSEIDMNELQRCLFSYTPAEILKWQDQSLKRFTGVSLKRIVRGKAEEKQSRTKVTPTMPVCKLSKYSLFADLSGGLCPVNVRAEDSFTAKNKGKKPATFLIRRTVKDPSLEMTISPDRGILKKGHRQKISVSIEAKRTGVVRELLEFYVEGGPSCYLPVSVYTKYAVFGVHSNSLPSVLENGLRIPRVLSELVKMFYEVDGVGTEGVMRIGASDCEVSKGKEELNRGLLLVSQRHATGESAHVVANLIKIWFRELPVAVFATVSEEQIEELDVNDMSACLQLVSTLDEPGKSLLQCLVDVAAHIAKNESVNRMNAQNLGIVLAPNLFRINTANPMVAIILSQKYSSLLSRLIEHRAGEIGT